MSQLQLSKDLTGSTMERGGHPCAQCKNSSLPAAQLELGGSCLFSELVPGVLLFLLAPPGK